MNGRMEYNSTNGNRFQNWLADHVHTVLLLKIKNCYPEIEKYGIKSKILHESLFETTDLSVLSALSAKMDSDRMFCLWNKKKKRIMGLAITLYINYLKEAILETSSDQQSDMDGDDKELQKVNDEADLNLLPTGNNNLQDVIKVEQQENITPEQKPGKARIPLKEAIVMILKDHLLLSTEEIVAIIREKKLYPLGNGNKERLIESTIHVSCHGNRFVKPKNCTFDYLEDSEGKKKYFLKENEDKIKPKTASSPLLDSLPERTVQIEGTPKAIIQMGTNMEMCPKEIGEITVAETVEKAVAKENNIIDSTDGERAVVKTDSTETIVPTTPIQEESSVSVDRSDSGCEVLDNSAEHIKTVIEVPLKATELSDASAVKELTQNTILSLRDAIVAVLSDKEVSLTVFQIFRKIMDANLFVFSYKNPISIIFDNIYRACRDAEYPYKEQSPLFGAMYNLSGILEFYLLSRESEISKVLDEQGLHEDETEKKTSLDDFELKKTISSIPHSEAAEEPATVNRSSIISITAKRKTICDAIVEVLSKVDRPLSAPEIYSRIVERKLYQFKAKQPINIVYAELNRGCKGTNHPQKTLYPLFGFKKEKGKKKRYFLLSRESEMERDAPDTIDVEEQSESKPEAERVEALSTETTTSSEVDNAKKAESTLQETGLKYASPFSHTEEKTAKAEHLGDYHNPDHVSNSVKQVSDIAFNDSVAVDNSPKEEIIFAYRKWLEVHEGLSQSTCNGYISAITSAEKFAQKVGCNSQTLFSNDASEVRETVDGLFATRGFIKINQRLHNLYGMAIDSLLLFVEDQSHIVSDTEFDEQQTKDEREEIPDSISKKTPEKTNEKRATPHNPYAKKRAKTPEEKLYKRIYREIGRVKYIGDILINDDEYEILLQYLRKLFSHFANTKIKKTDPILAVALVQIGIREYNGRYWPHVNRIIDIKIDGNKQGDIGNLFHKTLVAYDKIRLDRSQIVNNILMHCFVTKHYAGDFFEFLFAYYNYDLDRDLSQHTKEMRNYLMASMKKAEESSRAFRIKKGTADAATANESGCKIRVRNILKWIDAYMFEDVLPDKSPNRIAQFFCEWAKRSKRFRVEKNSLIGRGRSGKILFRSPYLHFDIKKEKFFVVMPVQTVPLSDDEDTASLSWRIRYNEKDSVILSDSESTVVGCKTREKEFFPIDSKEIFSKFKIELIKNDTTVIRTFLIKADTARFFDDEFDYFARNRLYEGKVYAFTRRNEFLDSDAEAIVEPYLSLNYYTFELVRGNVIKKPDNVALFVGKDLKEGLLEHNLLESIHVHEDENRFVVYNKAPSILIKIKESDLKGILLVINQNKHRLKAEDNLVFNSETGDDIYCLIRMEKFCVHNGVYHVLIDVPSERRTRDYDFALITGLTYQFSSQLYIYQSEGHLSLSGTDGIVPTSSISLTDNGYHFNVAETGTTLKFIICDIPVQVDIPLFQWRYYSDEPWYIEEPESLWHKELPDEIFIKAPAKSISICSDQVQLDEDTQSIQLDFKKDKNFFVCDTRKIKSWLDTGPALHHILVKIDNMAYNFLSILSRCVLTSCTLKEDLNKKQLILKSSILGYNDCVADIVCDEKIIADKIALTSNGAKYSTDKLYGNFEIIFYEYDDDDDFDFGEAVYSEFARKKISIKNRFNIVDKRIKVDYITENMESYSFFNVARYDIRDWMAVKIVSQDKRNPRIFYGKCQSTSPALANLGIRVILIEENKITKAILAFFDDQQSRYVNFGYDVNQKRLVTLNSSINSNKDSSRILVIDRNYYYHISVVQ